MVPGMAGLSPDPEKRRRQMAGLAKSNGVLAERLAADPDYGVSAGPPEAVPDPAPAPAPAASDQTIAGLPVHSYTGNPDEQLPGQTSIYEGGELGPAPAASRPAAQPAGAELEQVAERRVHRVHAFAAAHGPIQGFGGLVA